MHQLAKKQIMNKLKLLLPLFILVFTGFTKSPVPVQIITGIVTDRSTGEPIVGVMIFSPLNNKHTMTDAAGKYSLSLELADKHIKFSSIGYKTVIKEAKNNVLNVALDSDDHPLKEVVVGYVAAKRTSTSAGRSVASADRSFASPATSIALEGRVAGLKIESKTAAKTSSSIRDDQPQSNQLTAGEWNDIEHHGFWIDLMNNQEWSVQQSHWGFYTKRKISIRLQNDQQIPLNNYTVTAMDNGTILWKAQSNFEGKAELWPFFYNNEEKVITIVVNAPDGKELYKREIQPNLRELTITMDSTARKIRDLDVLFMVDATGSMGDEINYLKSELDDIIGRLNNNQQLNTRTALLFYRDHGDEYLIRDFGFDHNLSSVKQNLSRQYAGGGGDFEEAVDEAMDNAINVQQWTKSTVSTKIMFMILDAPPHYNAEKVKSLQRSVKMAAAKGIILIPVVASGIDKNTEFLMRFMAMGTNGTYVFITDDSGIGNSHLKPTVGKYQVEHLNNLLNRLIKKYAGLNAFRDHQTKKTLLK